MGTTQGKETHVGAATVLPMAKSVDEAKAIEKEIDDLKDGKGLPGEETMLEKLEERQNSAVDADLSERGLVGKRTPLDVDKLLDKEDIQANEIKFDSETKGYLPIDVARKHVQNLVQDIANMKDQHLMTMASVENHVVQYQQETHQKYEAFVESVKAMSMDCIANYKQALLKSREKLKQKEQTYLEQQGTLQTELKEAQKQVQALDKRLKKMQEMESIKETEEDEEEEEEEEEEQKHEIVDKAHDETLKKIEQVAEDRPDIVVQYIKLSKELQQLKVTRSKTDESRIREVEHAMEELLQSERKPYGKMDTSELLALSPTSFDQETTGDEAIPAVNEEGNHNETNTDASSDQEKGEMRAKLKEQKSLIFKLQTKLQDLWETQQDYLKEKEEFELKITKLQHEHEKRLNSANSGKRLPETENPTVEVEAKKQVEEKETKTIPSSSSSKEEDVEQKEDDSKREKLEKLEQEYKEKISELEKEVESLQKKVEEANSSAAEASNSNPSSKRYVEKLKAVEKKLKESEKAAKEFKNKASRLEQDLEKAKRLGGSGSGGAGDGKDNNDSHKLRKELEDLKKKQKKKNEETEKQHSKVVRDLEYRLKTLETEASEAQEALKTTKTQLAELRAKASKLSELEEENRVLHEKAVEAEELRTNYALVQKERDDLQEMYKEEQLLRKKYWNMMEDMKGKIRVFARCRPMAGYEKEKNCKQAVQFLDDCTLTVESSKGMKSFVYDQVFQPDSTQDQIFEDTKNLIQSSFDGYNVCVFAYGQTGSGKTFTMVGTPELPGLVRRTVQEVFLQKELMKGKRELVIKLNMMELYLDQLLDLLYSVKKKKDKDSVPKEPPKLDIKKDNQGTVLVKGAETVEVQSEEELLEYFELANASRKVASTQMNAGSSRSHMIFTLVLENTDLASKKTTKGKLNLVDLAGSERQEKTGATGAQLQEAMSINKSLSALGDVISALSSGEKFIPYRNNKLTQVMSDSLGGNAKTLMFVNISPADYNAEETISSLTYASRVKLITNNAGKSEESEEVGLLKKIIAELQSSGGSSDTLTSSNIVL